MVSWSIAGIFSSSITLLFIQISWKNVTYTNADKESDLTTLWLLVTICYTLPDHVTKDWCRAWKCLQRDKFLSIYKFNIPNNNVNLSLFFIYHYLILFKKRVFYQISFNNASNKHQRTCHVMKSILDPKKCYSQHKERENCTCPKGHFFIYLYLMMI